QFLRQTTGAKVLDAPQINVADNEMGKLFVGQQVPFIDKSQTTDVGALNQTFTYKDVGVILEVTPHINKEGDVALKIRAESSAIVPGFFFQAEDGIRDLTVTGVQTCALPISFPRY